MQDDSAPKSTMLVVFMGFALSGAFMGLLAGWMLWHSTPIQLAGDAGTTIVASSAGH